MRRAARLAIVASGALCAACGGGAARSDTTADTARAAGALRPGDSVVAPRDSGGTPAAAEPQRRPPAAPGSPGSPGRASTRPASDADTARGIVAVVGTPIDRRVTLRAEGGTPVRITGDLSATIGKLSGTEVWASGTRDASGSLAATEFVVRAVDGVPAIDGTLVARDGGKLAIVTRDHTEHPITNPPPALAARVGQRVWITGPLETGAVTFGVVQ